ncbi:hypothetical protein [Nocardia panacis]|uniref:hypothetical protein n=1 Tax=Nocardia panacis TaxID=2340916 RepID=UPI0013155EBF|nr:hypothetical protein [Nocardia panacis]
MSTPIPRSTIQGPLMSEFITALQEYLDSLAQPGPNSTAAQITFLNKVRDGSAFNH